MINTRLGRGLLVYKMKRSTSGRASIISALCWMPTENTLAARFCVVLLIWDVIGMRLDGLDILLFNWLMKAIVMC